MLGNTAPDVQTVSGQPREATHFFSVPIRDPRPAHEVLWLAFPELARPAGLGAARAAFLAGYIGHLWLDQLWIRNIFEPVFGEQAPWGTFRERLVRHNALRAHLDREVLGRLDGLGLELGRARIAAWLPFVADAALVGWRDLLAAQLLPGAERRTIEVFAERMRVPAHEFRQLVDDAAAMARQVFVHCPPSALAEFWDRGLAGSVELIRTYLDRLPDS